MANYATQFCEGILGITPDEKKWIIDALKEKSESVEDWAGFESHFLPDGPGKEIFVIESGADSSLDQALDFMQVFMKVWRPDDFLTLSWSFSCDQSKAGGFGGGAAVINSRGIMSINVEDWLKDAIKPYSGKFVGASQYRKLQRR